MSPTLSQPAGPTVVRTIEAVEGHRAAWNSIAWTRVDPELEYFLTVLRTRPEVVRPHVIFVPAEGEFSAFVGRLENVRLRTWAGYRAIYSPLVRSITLVHGGIAGADNTERAATLLGELRRSLSSGEADVAFLPSLRTDSPLYEAATALPSRLAQSEGESVHWGLRLPESFDDFIRSRSKKTRENVRVYRNRLVRDHGDRLSLKVFCSREEADVLFRDLDAVAARTYQRGLGVAFADTEEHRALTLFGLERGWWRAYVLYIADEPVAFWAGTTYNRTLFVGTPGYDPAYSAYSIGTYLLVRVVEQLCGDHEIDAIDFGFGDAEYKRRFGNESWTEADVLLFAPTVRAVRINLTRSAVGGAARLGRAALTRAGVASRLRQRWRRRLTKTRSG
jgi:CelD/BcsL family acetyltransferase involved in cellulose biosynthesis